MGLIVSPLTRKPACGAVGSRWDADALEAPMPTCLPAVTPHRTLQRRNVAKPVIASCLAMGAAAVALAVFIVWTCGDLAAAFLTLVMVSALIWVQLRALVPD